MQTPIVICEIGCNHKGDFDLAIEMIDVASDFCGVDVIKFQKRNPRELLTNNEYTTPHPNPDNAYGNTYGAHREFLEFDIGQHLALKKHCELKNVIYSSSVWDLTSAKDIASLAPSLIKIPSASNTNLNMIEWLFDNYDGEIHISLGMTKRLEENTLVQLANSKNRHPDLVLYHCISGYPVETKDLSLLEITRLSVDYSSRVKAIGFSGHHKGIAADIAALSLGSTYFERHFTLDRTWKGTDHAASLEPDGMRRLTRDLKSVATALTYKASEVLAVEEAQRSKLKHVEAAP